MKEELAKKSEEEKPDLTAEELEDMEPINPEEGSDLTADREEQPEMAETKVEKKKNFLEKAKEILSNPEIQKQAGKTFISSAASVVGLKSIYDVPEYFRERFKVRGMFGQGKGFEGSMEELMAASQQMHERHGAEEEITEEKEGKERHLEVREAIEDLSSRLKLTKEGSQKKSEQRNLIAKLLWENRHKEAMLKEDRHAEITKILDDYTTTKVTGIQAARESLNTLFVASGTFGFRGLSYGALAIAERGQRIEKEARQKGEKIKNRELLKRVFVDGVRETYQGATFGGEGTGKQKALRSIKSYGSIARFVGIAATMGFSPGSYNIDKVLNTLEGKTSWGEMGDNFLGNVKRLIDTPGRLKKFAGSILGTKEAGAAEIGTGILSPEAKGIQGLKQMVAEKFGLNVEDLKDVTGDKDVGDVDIAQIQSGKLGIPAISEPLSAENFRMAQELQEKAPSLIGKIFTDGKISEVESNILKSGWPDNIKLALLDDPADFANIQKIAESNPEIFKGLSEITEKQEIVNMAQIPKGGNISEVLGKAMAKDAAITIINPDGTKILNFDANLVHPGDTVIETGDGEICVLKTSGIEVEEGMSLEGIYDKIQGNLDKEGVPQEVQDYFNTNRAQGGWLGRINREEAENASEFWKKYSQKINELPPEQRGEFYEHTDFNKPEGVESKLDLLKKEAGIRRGEMEEEARKIWGEGKTPEEELLEKKPPVAPVGPGAGIKAPEGEIESYYPRGPKPGVPPTPGEVPLAKTPSEFREFRLPTYAEVIRTGLGGENINVPELNELYEAGKLTDSNIELIDRTSAQISLMRQELGNLDSTDSESIKHLSRLIEEKITGLRSTYGQSILKDNFTIFHPETFEDRARLLFTLKDLAGTRFHHLPVRFEPIEGMPGATSSHLIDNMVLSDIQKNLAGKENFNPSVLKKIIGDSSILLDEKERLEQHSRIISEFSYELTQHPLPDREKFILEEIREIVSADNEVYDPKVYGGNLFKKEVLELLESKPGVPPTPGIEETPPIRPGAEMPKEGVSHPEETPARTEAQAKERVGTEAGTPKGVPHPGETPVVTETEISAGEDIKQLMPEKSRSRGDAHDKIVNFFENKKPQEGLFDQAKQEATNRSIKFVPCGEPTANLDQSLVDEIDRYNANVTAYDNTVIESSKLSGELTDFNNNAAAQEGLASFKKISAEGMGGEKFKNIEWDEEVNDIYRNSPAGYDMNKIPVYDYQTIDHDQKSTLIYEALKIDRDSLVDKMKAEFRGEDIFDKKGEFKKDFLDLAGKNEEAKSLLNEYNDKSKAAAEYEKLAELHDKQETLRTNLMDNTKSIFETADKQDTETLTQEFITNNFSGKQEIRDGFTRIMKKEFKIKDVHSRNSIFNNLIWQNKPIAKYYLTEMNKGTEGQALERIKDYFRLVMERNSSIIKDKDIGDRLKAYVSHYPFYPDAPYETLLEKK